MRDNQSFNSPRPIDHKLAVIKIVGFGVSPPAAAPGHARRLKSAGLGQVSTLSIPVGVDKGQPRSQAADGGMNQNLSGIRRPIPKKRVSGSQKLTCTALHLNQV
jgi:hypothetical protein